MTRKLDASDAQLKRSRSLKSSCVGSENIENKSPPVGDEKIDLRDEAAEDAKEVCAFALLNNGECKRQTDAKFKCQCQYSDSGRRCEFKGIYLILPVFLKS